MVKTCITFLFTTCLVLSQGGCGDTPKREEMIGTWSADDGARIQFLDDGTFIATNFSAERMFEAPERLKGRRSEETGAWEFGYFDGSWFVWITFRSIDEISSHAYCFAVLGSGILGNRRPWKLTNWYGDQEVKDIYWFTKK